jgi:maltooligosyltrehalose trehalohydrolase
VTELRVWAPGHDNIDAVLDERRVAMHHAGGGWWAVDIGPAGVGARYRFSVDGGPPRPDPRSAWQPEGVDGPSALVDHVAFAWGDHAWQGGPLGAAVLYECHVGTFTEEGTFDAAVDHLDDLVELGVTAVELLPVAEFPGERGWGYDGVSLWAPHHRYGGPDGLKRLVDAAHARGLAVVLDVVYNHLGPAGNHLAEFGPYFTDRYATPWGAAVNVDGPGSDEVRRFVVDNACAWLEHYHLDGLRLDAVHAIVDMSALHLLEELAGAVADLSRRTGRQRWLIAESDRNDPRLVRSPQAGGYGLDATWSDELHHALHAVLTGESDGYYADFGSLAQLARAVERAWVYGRDYSPFRGRHHGLPAGDLPGDRFVVFLQNHDQVGNRAIGERMAALVSPGRLAAGAALVLTSPYVPLLFQGEEWGASTPWQYFTDHPDPDLGRAVSEGRRSEFAAFGWDPGTVPDPQDPATWRRSVLDWSERSQPAHARILDWHRTLLRLRREVPDLGDGRRDRVAVRFSDADRWLVVERGRVSVAVNLGSRAGAVPLRPGGEVLAAFGPAHTAGDGAVHLPADGVAVLFHPDGAAGLAW